MTDIDRVAEPIGRIEKRHVPRLIGGDPLVLDDPGIVLHRPVGDDHVADAQRGVEAAGDTEKTISRQPNRLASSVTTRAVVTLPIPAATRTTSCPSSRPWSNCSTPSDGGGARIGLMRRLQVGQLLGDGADQADGQWHGSSFHGSVLTQLFEPEPETGIVAGTSCAAGGAAP